MIETPVRCDEGEGPRFQVITTAGSVEDNFSNLGCNNQYKEYFNKTNNQCGVEGEGELVEVEARFSSSRDIHMLRVRSASRQKAMGSFTGCSQVVMMNSRHG